MTAPLTHGLEVTWTDHRGKVWDLTRGTEGVVLDMEQSGLDWAEIKQTYARGGSTHQVTSLERGVHHLAVTVGWDRQGADYRRLRAEWWTEANSPYMDKAGVLAVTAPGGETRTRRLVLDASPETTFRYDPLLGVDYPVEVWTLSGPGPWWYGQTQLKTLRLEDFRGAENSVPFYGPRGAGWPLYISGSATSRDLFMSNNGQGPMWVTWTLTGPMSRPRFGTSTGVLSYDGDLLAGETLVVQTAPTSRSVVEVNSGESRYAYLTGQYAALPPGDRSSLVVAAEGLTSESSIIAEATTTYATAF